MLFDVLTSLFGIMNQYDPTVDLKVNVGHCDLYSGTSIFQSPRDQTVLFELMRL